MNLIVDLCANAAAGYISQGKLVEAIPNLRAAMYFGGNEAARINSIFVASRFAAMAQEAFARGDIEDAMRNAGLSLAAYQNETALIVLAQIHLGRDPVGLEDIARQLAEIAPDDDPRGLKINALVWRLDALQQILPRDTGLEESIGREALAAVNKFVDQHPDVPQVLMVRAMLHRRFGNIPSALQDMRRIQLQAPGDAPTAASCLELTKNLSSAEARADLLILANSSDSNPSVLTQYYDLARRCGAKAVADGLLARLAPLNPGFHYLLDLKQSQRAAPPHLTLGAVSAQPKASRFFFFAIDDAACSALITVTLPMLLAPGNLPAWSAAHATVIDITAPDNALERLAKAPCLQRLAAYARIELRGAAAPPAQFERRAYGLVFEATMDRARAENACVIAPAPFSLIGDGALTGMATLAAGGVDALMLDPLEAATAPLRGWLGEGDRNGDPLVMKAADLCSSVLRHLPPPAQRSLVDHEGKIESTSRRLIFAKPDGLSVRSIDCRPVFLSAAAVAAIGEEVSDPPDGFVIDRLLACEELKVTVLENAADCPIALLRDVAGNDFRHYPRQAVDVVLEQVRTAPLSIDRARLLASGTRWFGPKPSNAVETDDEAESAIAAQIIGRVAGP